MRRLALLAPLLLARPALANQCNSRVPQIVTTQLPKGCPLVAYVLHDLASTFPPRATIYKNGQTIDVTGTVTTTLTQQEVSSSGYDENCVYGSGTTTQPYDQHSIDLVGVEIGDVVTFAGGYNEATIGAAGPCPTPEAPLLFCDPPYNPDCIGTGSDMPTNDPTIEDDSVGCNAGKSAGLAAAAALLIALRRRR